MFVARNAKAATRRVAALRLQCQSRHWQHYQRFGGPQRRPDLSDIVRSPRFYYYCGAAGVGGGVFYTANLETVPVTGRRRFNVVSEESEKASADQLYRQLLQQYGNAILSRRDPRTRMVERVLDRLIPATGLTSQSWEVHVIEDPGQANAFVIPGGKVFVFTGILKYCKDETGVAAVLGHEIAHTVARHSAESTSRMVALMALYYVAAVFIQGSDILGRFIIDYGFQKPGSRKQEVRSA
ncbi:MAG: hypothetical protein M1828_006799 [Chrysothrix sp. TS-e1954]|nr:MAG: hypothetical protein M1828_006799 [Chrysothrix sp. TS-e1954]